MSAVERLAILVTADGQGAIREFNKVGSAAERELGGAESRADRLGSRMTSAGAVMMGASAVMVAGLYSAGKSAAALEQAVGGTEAVFKDSAGTIQTWAKGAAQSAGLSEEAAMRLTTRLGGALKGLGYDQQEAADQAVELGQVAADLAATYGGTTADAVQALGAAFRGEFDPAEQFNLFLKQSTVDAKAVEMGLAASTTKVDAHARAQATLALIMEGSTDAQGQFARETDTTSGRLAIAQAEFENLKAQVGAGFTPVMSAAGDIVGKFSTALSGADDATGGMASKMLGFGAVGLGFAGAISFVVGQVISMRENIGTAITKIKEFTAAHQSAGKAVAGVGMALAAAVLVWDRYQDAQQEALDALDVGIAQAKTNALGESFDELVAHLGRVREQQAGVAQDWNPMVRSGEGAIDELGDSMQHMITVAALMADETGRSRDEVLAWLQSEEANGRTYETSAAALAVYTQDVDQYAGSVEAASAANEALAARIKEANDATRAAVDPFFAASKASQDLADAQLAAFLTSQQYGAGAPETLAANEQLAQTALDAESSFMALAEQMKANGTTTDDMKAAFQRWVEQGWISQDQADQVITKFGMLGDKAEDVGSKNVDIPVSTSGVGAAIGNLDALKRKVEELGRVQTGVQIQGASLGIGAPVVGAITKRAGGGPVEPWSAYRVHDTDSPELLGLADGTSMLLTGSQPGYVTNLGNAPAATPASSGGGSVTINLYTAPGTPASQIDDMLRLLRQNQGEVQRAIGI